jgi:hypothetical protein
MAEEPENVVLLLLRRLDEKLDRLVDDVRDLKLRMTLVENGLATLNGRVDRIEARLERIERRLDLVEVS